MCSSHRFLNLESLGQLFALKYKLPTPASAGVIDGWQIYDPYKDFQVCLLFGIAFAYMHELAEKNHFLSYDEVQVWLTYL